MATHRHIVRMRANPLRDKKKSVRRFLDAEYIRRILNRALPLPISNTTFCLESRSSAPRRNGNCSKRPARVFEIPPGNSRTVFELSPASKRYPNILFAGARKTELYLAEDDSRMLSCRWGRWGTLMTREFQAA